MERSIKDLLPQDFTGGRLRRLRVEDLAAFQAYRAIPEVGRFQGWSPLVDSAAMEFLVEMNTAPLFMPGHWVQLGIAEPEADGLIGDIGIYISDDGRTGDVGFTLAPAFQGRGIAAAAVRQALQILFTNTEVEHMRGITDSRNAPSIRLLKRLGFQHRESRTVVFRGEPCGEEILVLFRDQFDWEARP